MGTRYTRNYRPPFDPAAEFVASPRAGAGGGVPVLRVGGLELQAGEPLAKGLVVARRLRQMYEQRLIQFAPGWVPARKAKAGAATPKSAEPPPSRLPSIPRATPKQRAVSRRRAA